MFDAKTLLLIHQHQAEVAEFNVLGKQPVRADGDIHLTFGQLDKAGLQLLGGTETAEHLHTHRKGLEAAFEGLEMLKCEHCSRRQHGHLLAVPQRFERRPHHHFRLAETDVAAKQAVHGLGAFHVALDILDGVDLVFGSGEFEGIFELPLPVAI